MSVASLHQTVLLTSEKPPSVELHVHLTLVANADASSHAQSSERGLRHSNRKGLQTKQVAYHLAALSQSLARSKVHLAASSVFESYACKIKKHYVNTKSTDAFKHDAA